MTSFRGLYHIFSSLCFALSLVLCQLNKSSSVSVTRVYPHQQQQNKQYYSVLGVPVQAKIQYIKGIKAKSVSGTTNRDSRTSKIVIDPVKSATIENRVSTSVKLQLEDRLEKLRNTLLNYYQKKSQEFATGRGGGGGIGFPSLEGALLSLAFLTFAVFLIDLIQQLLSRVTTTNVVLGRRRRRSTKADNTTFLDLLNLTSDVISKIENPGFHEAL